jgi:hypothetical protein
VAGAELADRMVRQTQRYGHRLHPRRNLCSEPTPQVKPMSRPRARWTCDDCRRPTPTFVGRSKRGECGLSEVWSAACLRCDDAAHVARTNRRSDS